MTSKVCRLLVVLVWLAGLAWLPTDAAAQADLELIKHQVRQAAQKRQQERKVQPGFEESPNELKENSFFGNSQVIETLEKPLPPDKVFYSWWGGRVRVRRVAGNWYLSIW